MTPRGSGRRQVCTNADATARFHDAEAFLDTAEAATDPNVKATNAIAAADAICCFALRERCRRRHPRRRHRPPRHRQRPTLRHLRRAPRPQTASGLRIRDISAKDAATSIRQATTLVDAARSRALTA